MSVLFLANKEFNLLVKVKFAVLNSVHAGIKAYSPSLFRDFKKLLLPIWRSCGLCYHEGQKHKSVQGFWICEV